MHTHTHARTHARTHTHTHTHTQLRKDGSDKMTHAQIKHMKTQVDTILTLALTLAWP